MEVDKNMLFTGIVFTLIGIMARTYAGIFEIHDSTWKAMKASIVRKVAALAGNISLIIGILCIIASFT
ncbi:hypothetical protein HMPREF2738_02823 [Clostridiales bacterium KLE1615]|jgi:hypothetical protein|nr:hypothetical protein HMPREF2738_02823 [Clostridiales bacterium KLE1615]